MPLRERHSTVLHWFWGAVHVVCRIGGAERLLVLHAFARATLDRLHWFGRVLFISGWRYLAEQGLGKSLDSRGFKERQLH
jgi:hypothetical protein